MNTQDTTIAPPSPDAPLDAETTARNRLVISLLLVSAFVVILNETIMGVAIPRLMADLGVTASAAQWLTTAFLLTMAIVIPITGFLLQRLLTRTVFVLAMSMFSLGTLVSALAPGLAMLVVGRIVQAIGTALMMPLLMTTVMNLVPPETRGLVMGLMAPPVGRLYDRHGPTPLILPGAFLVSAVMWGMAFMNEFTHVGWLLAAHIVLSIGLALMFTPLFSASLGSLPPRLYSHGSAVIGTIQQVAGAAGTALFIALMANQMAALTASGLSEVASTAGGIRTAYFWGAVISTFAVVAAFFVRKPEGPAHPAGPSA